MALQGKAALAMWWNIAPEQRAGFEHWHSSEHFAERLGVPGFLSGTRWTAVSGAPHYFVMYELDGLEVLGSPAYRERLNHPTPWTTRTMANFRNMIRSQCRVLGSAGAGVGEAMLTLRFSPRAGRAEDLRTWLAGELLPTLVERPGLCAAHLLQNAVPPVPFERQTAEQKLRGGDTTADWVLLVGGYDADVVADLGRQDLRGEVLAQRGVAEGSESGVYRLSFAMTRQDLPSISGGA